MKLSQPIIIMTNDLYDLIHDNVSFIYFLLHDMFLTLTSPNQSIDFNHSYDFNNDLDFDHDFNNDHDFDCLPVLTYDLLDFTMTLYASYIVC